MRLSIKITGEVQGVGFRTLICKLADYLHLYGWVKYTKDGGLIAEVQGNSEQLEYFSMCLSSDAPSEAKIEGISYSQIPCNKDRSFIVLESGE